MDIIKFARKYGLDENLNANINPPIEYQLQDLREGCDFKLASKKRWPEEVILEFQNEDWDWETLSLYQYSFDLYYELRNKPLKWKLIRIPLNEEQLGKLCDKDLDWKYYQKYVTTWAFLKAMGNKFSKKDAYDPIHAKDYQFIYPITFEEFLQRTYKDWTWISEQPFITVDIVAQNEHQPWRWKKLTHRFTFMELMKYPDLPWDWLQVLSKNDFDTEMKFPVEDNEVRKRLNILKIAKMITFIIKSESAVDFGIPQFEHQDKIWHNVTYNMPIEIIIKKPSLPWDYQVVSWRTLTAEQMIALKDRPIDWTQQSDNPNLTPEVFDHIDIELFGDKNQVMRHLNIRYNHYKIGPHLRPIALPSDWFYKSVWEIPHKYSVNFLPSLMSYCLPILLPVTQKLPQEMLEKIAEFIYQCRIAPLGHQHAIQYIRYFNFPKGQLA